MSAAPVTDQRHYMNLPMCGFCMNAWDLIYMRLRPGSRTSAQRWVEYCKVGGCDPDVWDYIDLETGWPTGYIVNEETGLVDWLRVSEEYVIPDYDDSVFHMRLSDGPGVRWRKMMPQLISAFSKTRGAGRYTDNGTLPEEDIVWGEDDKVEQVPEPDVGNLEDVSDPDFVDDDDIEW